MNGRAEDSGVPAAPHVKPSATYHGAPTALADGRWTIGWDGSGDETSFVTLQRTRFGMLKVRARYPLTGQGWASAWKEFTGLDPDQATVDAVRVALAVRVNNEDSRSAARELAARTLGAIPGAVFLGGYSPGALLTARQAYDLRFLGDRLSVYEHGQAGALTDLAYPGIRLVEIGGPGLVRSGGGFAGGGRGLAGAAEGMAVAAVLNALTTRTKITTIIQIQAADSELFFLDVKTPPQDLRIRLSRALGAVREARAAPPPAVPDSIGPPTLVGELEQLGRLHEAGLLTLEEFAQAKAKLINGV